MPSTQKNHTNEPAKESRSNPTEEMSRKPTEVEGKEDRTKQCEDTSETNHPNVSPPVRSLAPGSTAWHPPALHEAMRRSVGPTKPFRPCPKLVHV